MSVQNPRESDPDIGRLSRLFPPLERTDEAHTDRARPGPRDSDGAPRLSVC